jgi:hypothetical protein
MNNSDNFEAIAADAVSLIIATLAVLNAVDTPETDLAGLLISAKAEDLCLRAIALGSE